MTCVPSKDADQPGHPPSLTSLTCPHEEGWVLTYPKSSQRRQGRCRYPDDLSFRWAHASFCCFCHAQHHFINSYLSWIHAIVLSFIVIPSSYHLALFTISENIIEPSHDKTKKMICAPSERLRSAWASAQSDQSLRCPQEESLGPQLSIEHTAKTGQMHRLNWVFAGRTSHFVGFVMRRFICKFHSITVTSSPKGNDCSPESNVPRSNLISKKHINGPWKPEARNRTRPSHHFPHYKSMGAFCCHGNQSFDPICPKTLCSLSLASMMLHIKFDQDWPTGFRDIQVQKCEIFITQGQVTSKWVVWFGPKSNSTELLCLSWLPATLMMTELVWRHHFPIINLWEIF